MNTSWQVVLLWEVPPAGLIVLDDLYLLSLYLKSGFEISEMRNLKKKKRLMSWTEGFISPLHKHMKLA